MDPERELTSEETPKRDRRVRVRRKSKKKINPGNAKEKQNETRYKEKTSERQYETT